MARLRAACGGGVRSALIAARTTSFQYRTTSEDVEGSTDNGLSAIRTCGAGGAAPWGIGTSRSPGGGPGKSWAGRFAVASIVVINTKLYMAGLRLDPQRTEKRFRR